MPRRDNPICSEFCQFRDIGKECGNNAVIRAIAKKKGRGRGADAFDALADAPDEVKETFCMQMQKKL